MGDAIPSSSSDEGVGLFTRVSALNWRSWYIYLLIFGTIFPAALSVVGSIVIVELVVSGVKTATSASVLVLANAFLINSATRVVVSKTFGSLSDFVGRKPLLVWSAICWIVSRGFLVSATADEEIYLAAFIYGLDVFSPVSQAWIADIVVDEERGKAYGVAAGVGFGLAFAMGLPVGGALSQYHGPQLPIYIGMALQLVVIVAVVVAPISDTVGIKCRPGDGEALTNVAGDSERDSGSKNVVSSKNRRLPTETKKFFYDNSIVPIFDFSNPDNVILRASENPWDYFAYFFAQASQQSLTSVFIPFVQAAYNFSQTESGLALAFVAISVAIFAPVALNYYQERGVIFWAICIQIAGSFVFMISGLPESDINGAGAPIGILGMFLIAAGGTWIPAFPSVITKQYNPDDKGEVLGTTTLLSELSNILAYPVGRMLAFMLSHEASIRWPGAIWIVTGTYLTISVVSLVVTTGSKAYTLERVVKVIPEEQAANNKNSVKPSTDGVELRQSSSTSDSNGKPRKASSIGSQEVGIVV